MKRENPNGQELYIRVQFRAGETAQWVNSSFRASMKSWVQIPNSHVKKLGVASHGPVSPPLGVYVCVCMYVCVCARAHVETEADCQLTLGLGRDPVLGNKVTSGE